MEFSPFDQQRDRTAAAMSFADQFSTVAGMIRAA
jgi:hypothetical protein